MTGRCEQPHDTPRITQTTTDLPNYLSPSWSKVPIHAKYLHRWITAANLFLTSPLTNQPATCTQHGSLQFRSKLKLSKPTMSTWEVESIKPHQRDFIGLNHESQTYPDYPKCKKIPLCKSLATHHVLQGWKLTLAIAHLNSRPRNTTTWGQEETNHATVYLWEIVNVRLV